MAEGGVIGQSPIVSHIMLLNAGELGDRREEYGYSNIKLIFITPNGRYIDVENEDELKKYVVVGQSPEPNTELKLTYQKNNKGKEYDNLIEHQSIEEMEIKVKKIDNN